LVDNNSATNPITVNGGGFGDFLNVTSGAFLFVGSGSTPQGITLSGFSNGITTETNNSRITASPTRPLEPA